MFGLFKKDPLKKLRQDYAALTEKAMHAQRNGDIEGYSKLSTEAAAMYEQIQKMEATQN